jgi:hypothetical protein
MEVLMKMSKWVKLLLSFVLFMALFFSLQDTKAAEPREGTVDVTSGHLNVRSSASATGTTLGKLYQSNKVNVYSQTASGWSEIRYNNQKAYVASAYLRFYGTMRAGQVQSITDRAELVQRKTWNGKFTKKQVYDMMAEKFTKVYIDSYFPQQMQKAGKDRYGNQLYSVIPTEIWGTPLIRLTGNLHMKQSHQHMCTIRKTATII